MPRCDRDAVVADERHPLAPGDAHVGAVVDAREAPELAAGADVPDADGAIGAERGEARAVRAEPGREDAAAMRAQRVEQGRRWRHPRASRCRRRFLSRRVLPSGLYAVARTSPVCPVSLASFWPVSASRMLGGVPLRSEATKRDASGERETSVADAGLSDPRPGTARSTREVSTASCRACSASTSMVPSCRRVVSAASIASRMLALGVDGEVRLR